MNTEQVLEELGVVLEALNLQTQYISELLEVQRSLYAVLCVSVGALLAAVVVLLVVSFWH